MHPHNIAQKTEIIIEHFRDITKDKIGGKAKAMVVTASRLHALRYLFAFRKYIEEHHYDDLNVLVAFSGNIMDNGQEWSEEKLNGIKESQLKVAFHDDFNVLIVAEKYQTGFDEPLLHTTFIDKKLSSVKAVQTLSRLNRTIKGKEDTFVLDFANTQEEIQRAFQPYYEATILEKETNPNVIYALKRKIDDFHIYQKDEIEEFAKKFYQKSNPTLESLSSILKPVTQRYEALRENQKEDFKALLHRFNRIYSFIIQVCRMFDKEMQKLYIFTQYLAKLLPKDNLEKINLNDALLLEYYKSQKTSEGKITLAKEEGFVAPVSKADSGSKNKEMDSLSKIIDEFNKRFGTNFTEQEKVLAQLRADFIKKPDIANSIKKKDKTLLRGLYGKIFMETLFNRYQENNQFLQEVIANEEKIHFIKKKLLEDLLSEF